MEPPSPALAAALRDLRLATPRNLKRAANRCRSIARDLPTFDCIWIDALLAQRRLTAFQAERLQEGDASRLRVGGYVLIDRLGRGPNSKTYLARSVTGGVPLVLKRIDRSDLRDRSVRERLESLVEAGRGLRSGHLVVPEQVLDAEEGLFAVSRFVPGQDVRVRLVRHGRINGEAVAEIAFQLASELAEAHRSGLPHGEIRASNLRITRTGEAVLVDHGVATAVSPALLVDRAAPPESYDGVAPELIGTGGGATAAADVYALGCLLWHLLAGRPPFAFGDPLAKLAAHRTGRVPDVRDFAPDPGNDLARLIAEMTASDPAQRLTDLEVVRRTLRRSTRRGQAALRRASSSGQGGRFPWSVAAAALLALSGLSVSLLDRGAASTLLRTTLGDGAESAPAAVAHASSDLSALPPPDAQGTIFLEHSGPYAAADVAFRGPIVLRGRPGQPATIVVTDRPLHLWAESVVLENVVVRHAPSTATLGGPPALALIEAQSLTVRSCRFGSPLLPAERRDGAPTALAWRMVDRADPTGGRVEIRDTAFRGAREALFAGDRLRRFEVENVLSVGQRAFLSLGAAGGDSAATFRNVTLREASFVISCRDASAPRRITVAAEDCVIDLIAGGRVLSGGRDSSDLRWSGSGVFASREFGSDVEEVRTADSSPSPIEGDGVEGIVPADIAFAGPADGSDAASVARVSGAPRLAGRPVGFDLSRLPREIPVPGRAR